MPRTIEVSAAPGKIDELLQRIEPIEGVVSLARQEGASLRPPGDVLTIQTTTDAARAVFGILAELKVADAGSINTSSPLSILTQSNQKELDQETNETVWDEMAFMLRGDTNTSPNYLISMLLAGAAAAGGLWSDTLHLVVGAMLIAPAFEPLARIPFGFIVRSPELMTRGLLSVAGGYFMLALGAMLSTALLALWDPETAREFANQEWVQYWSSFTFPGIFVSTVGAIAGAIVIGGQRSVLTTGVMVTLALIPSLALAGMGLITADFALASKAFMRWVIDVLLVLAMSGAVFWLKRHFLHRHSPAIS